MAATDPSGWYQASANVGREVDTYFSVISNSGLSFILTNGLTCNYSDSWYKSYQQMRRRGVQIDMDDYMEQLSRPTFNGRIKWFSYEFVSDNNSVTDGNHTTNATLGFVGYIAKVNYSFIPQSTGGKDGNPDFTIHYATETNIPGLPNLKLVTSTSVGEGPVHMKSVNGSNPSLIKTGKSGPLTYEIEYTKGGSSSLSLSIGNYYISGSYGDETFSFGFGMEQGNFSAGYEMEAPTLVLQLLLLPVRIETPVPVPIPIRLW